MRNSTTIIGRRRGRYRFDSDERRGHWRSIAQVCNKDRILFGSDYPLITPERWMKDFQEAGFKPEVMPGILKDNAVRLLNLAPVRMVEGYP